MKLGKHREAIKLHEQVLAIDREIGDRLREALASWNLGVAYEELGEIEKAISAMQFCVDYEREIEHPSANEHARYLENLRRKLNS
jgi:tetratricopeptide (TPR) repeat protein